MNPKYLVNLRSTIIAAKGQHGVPSLRGKHHLCVHTANESDWQANPPCPLSAFQTVFYLCSTAQLANLKHLIAKTQGKRSNTHKWLKLNAFNYDRTMSTFSAQKATNTQRPLFYTKPIKKWNNFSLVVLLVSSRECMSPLLVCTEKANLPSFNSWHYILFCFYTKKKNLQFWQIWGFWCSSWLILPSMSVLCIWQLPYWF